MSLFHKNIVLPFRYLSSCRPIFQAYSKNDINRALAIFKSNKSELSTKDYQSLFYHFSQNVQKTVNQISFPQILSIFQNFASIEVYSTNIDNYNTLLKFFLQYQRPASEIISLFNSICDLSLNPNEETISILIRGLVQYNEVDSAYKIYEYASDKNIDISISTYSILLKGLLQRGVLHLCRTPISSISEQRILNNKDIKKAEELAHTLLKSNISLDTKFLQPFLISYNKLLYPKGCLYWIDMAEKLDISPLTPLYNLLIDTYCKMGDLDSAKACMEKMKISNDKEKLYPNSFTYGSIIQLMTEKDSNTNVLDFFQEMKRSGIPLDTEIWNVVLWNFAKRGQVRKVEFIYDKMIKGGFEPDQLTYNARLVAISTYQQITPHSINFRSLIFEKPHNLNKKAESKFENLLLIYNEMLAKEIYPNSKTINTLLLYGIKNQHFKKSIEIFNDTMKLIDHNPILLRKQLDPIDIDENQKFLHPKDKPLYSNSKLILDTTSFNLITTIYLRFGDYSNASNLISNILPKYNLKPDQWSFYIILKYLENTTNFLEIEKWVRLLKQYRNEMGLSGNLVVDRSPLDKILKEIRNRKDIDSSLKMDIDWLREKRNLSLDTLFPNQ